MNFKHKLGYMCIGCLFTIAGYIIASLGGGATHAQQEKQVIDEIVCRKLRVVNAAGKDVAIIGADEGGNGVLGISNKAEKAVVVITTTSENGGLIGVYNAAEKEVAGIFTAENGGV